MNQPLCVTQPLGTGITCFVVDVDPATPGEQSALTLPATGAFTVDIVARDVPVANNGLGSFNITLLYDNAWLTAGTPTMAELKTWWSVLLWKGTTRAS